MYNGIFYIAFFGVYGVASTKKIVNNEATNAVFDSYINNESRRSVFKVQKGGLVDILPSMPFEEEVIEKITKLEFENNYFKEKMLEFRVLNEKIKYLEEKQCYMQKLCCLALRFKKDEIISGIHGINGLIDINKMQKLSLNPDNLIRFECTRCMYIRYLAKAKKVGDEDLQIVYQKNIAILDSFIETMKAIITKGERDQSFFLKINQKSKQFEEGGIA